MKGSTRQQAVRVLLLAAVAVLGAAGMRWAAARGIGLNPDSAFYIDGAVHLAAGQGYRSSLHRYFHPLSADEYVRQTAAPGGVEPRPCRFYLPFYPAVLALPIMAGARPESAALWLAVLLFGLNIFLVGLAVSDVTRGSPAFIVGAALLTASSESMLVAHGMALSEALFIFLCLSGLRLLGSYLESGRPAGLVWAGIVSGLATLTRYPGAALVGTGVFGLMAFAGKPLRRKAVTALVYAALGLFPVAAFVLGGHFAIDTSALRPESATALAGALEGLASWIMPGTQRIVMIPGQAVFLAAVAAAVLLVLTASCLLAARTRAGGPQPGLQNGGRRSPVLYAAFIPAYLAFFLAADAILKGCLLPDIRLLSPLFPPFLVVVAWRLKEGLGRMRSTGKTRIVVAVLGVYAAVYSGCGAYWMSVCHRQGRGYNNSSFQAPDVEAAMAQVRTLGAVPIFTNDCGALYFQAGRYAYQFPSRAGVKAPAALAEALGDLPACFVYYWTPAHVRAHKNGESRESFEGALIAALGLETLFKSESISVFRRPGRS